MCWKCSRVRVFLISKAREFKDAKIYVYPRVSRTHNVEFTYITYILGEAKRSFRIFKELIIKYYIIGIMLFRLCFDK